MEKLKKVWLKGKAYLVNDEQFKAIHAPASPGETLLTEDEAINIATGKTKLSKEKAGKE